MRKVTFKSWAFKVDLELTEKSYAMKSTGSADECLCEYCENYRKQRNTTFPKEIKSLLNEFGIDFRKENDVSEYAKLENGLHYYVGQFSFAGKILQGKKFNEGSNTEIEFTKISENFSIAFGEKKDSFWVTFMFESDLPWLIKDTSQHLAGNLPIDL